MICLKYSKFRMNEKKYVLQNLIDKPFFFFHKVELAYVNIILITHTHCNNKKQNDVRVVKKEHCENKICLKFIMNYRK